MSEAAPTRRRWFQFSIGTTLLLMTAFALWLAFYASPAKRQGRAAEALKRVGANVLYDFQRVVHKPDKILESRFSSAVPVEYLHAAQPPGPPWAHRLLGDDFFQSPEWVRFNAKTVALSVDDLRPFRQLPHLRLLGLGGCGLTDGHLAELAGLAELELLDLGENDLTDDGLAALAGMKKLRVLTLSENRISGTGLKHLTALHELRQLFLYDNPISDEGLANLAAVSNLELLGIGRTNVTDDGLTHLATLKSLRYVSLGVTKVSKAGASLLQANLPQCEVEHW